MTKNNMTAKHITKKHIIITVVSILTISSLAFAVVNASLLFINGVSQQNEEAIIKQDKPITITNDRIETPDKPVSDTQVINNTQPAAQVPVTNNTVNYQPNTNTVVNESPTYKPDYTEQLAACEDLNESYLSIKTTSFNAAEGRHQNNISSINSSWSERGMYYSGGRELDLANELSRYQTEISRIETTYQQQLSVNDCSRY